MRIYIVRHGISRSNQKSTYSSPDTPLAPEAADHLKPVADRLSRIKFDKIYSSDLPRAINTTKILGYEEPIIEPRIAERNFGVFIGHTHEECLELFPGLYAQYQNDPVNYRIPSGESFHDLCDRVWAFLDEISAKERSANPMIRGFRPRAADESQVLLVGHFNVIAAAMCWVFNNRDLSHHLVCDNGGVMLMDIRGKLKTIFIETDESNGYSDSIDD